MSSDSATAPRPRNRLTNFVIDHARAVVAACVTAIVLAGVWGAGVVSELSLGGYADPSSEAARVDDIVEARFDRTVPDVAIVYTPTDGRSVDDIREAVETNLAEIDRSLLVRDPVTYWSVPPQFAQGLVSFDGRSVIAVLTFTGDEDTRVKSYLDIRDDRLLDGVDVQFGGFSTIIDAYNTQARADLIRAEVITFPILMVLLLIIFGGVTAAAVPLCIGGMAILASLAVMRVLTYFTEVSVFATNIATLVGLGMAVDYSLFILTRFREELRRGSGTTEAVRRTMSTAGRTVAFSALLLVCGFIGMLIFPQAMVRSLGFGGMAAVGAAAFVSLTALPAALVLLGPRINSLSWRKGAIDRGEQRAERFWGSVAERVMRKPLVVAAAIVAFLALLSAPIIGVGLGDLDHRGLPGDAPARIATERLFDEFPLANSGVTVMVQSTDGRQPDSRVVAQVAAEVGQVDGIAAALPAESADDYSLVRAILSSPDRTARGSRCRRLDPRHRAAGRHRHQNRRTDSAEPGWDHVDLQHHPVDVRGDDHRYLRRHHAGLPVDRVVPESNRDGCGEPGSDVRCADVDLSRRARRGIPRRHPGSTSGDDEHSDSRRRVRAVHGLRDLPALTHSRSSRPRRVDPRGSTHRGCPHRTRRHRRRGAADHRHRSLLDVGVVDDAAAGNRGDRRTRTRRDGSTHASRTCARCIDG